MVQPDMLELEPVSRLLPSWLPVPLKSAWIPLDHVFMLAHRNQNVV